MVRMNMALILLMRINIFYPHSGTPILQPPCALVLYLCMAAFRTLRCGISAVRVIKSRIL